MKELIKRLKCNIPPALLMRDGIAVYGRKALGTTRLAGRSLGAVLAGRGPRDDSTDGGIEDAEEGDGGSVEGGL